MATMTTGQQTAEAIRSEAAYLFATRGYGGTSLRDVASRVGIKVGSLYNHIASKQELLLSVMGHTMDDLMAEMNEAVDRQDDTIDKLITFVEHHIRFHAERAQEVFIGNSELRSLEGGPREEIVRKRRAYRIQLEELLTRAGEEGVADVVNARLHAYSIVAMGTHVAGWYREDGAFDIDEIISTYTTLILRSLAVPDADRRVDAVLRPV